MSTIRFSTQSRVFFQESALSPGKSVEDLTRSVAKRVLGNVENDAPASLFGTRFSLTGSGAFTWSSVRHQSSQSGVSRAYPALQTFEQMDPQTKMRLLTYNGLRVVGASAPVKTFVTDQEVRLAWGEVAQVDQQLPKYDSIPDKDFVALAMHLPPDDSASKRPFRVEDHDESLLALLFANESRTSIRVPFERPNTPDSDMGNMALLPHVKNGAYIIEDGCDHGQHLVCLADRLRQNNVQFKAFGMDIIASQSNIARMLTASVGMDSVLSFGRSNALYRRSPREISGKKGQHIVVAYRLLPVFHERKLMRYLKKVSDEMESGDLWCGSLALPSGNFYTRNTSNHQIIHQHCIQRIPMSIGGETFVHHPDFSGQTDQQMCRYFNKMFGSHDLAFSEQDLSNMILNTFMSQGQFEDLVKKFDMKFARAPIPVSCSDNDRLVVILEKA